jgi:hypothetical protein
MTEKINLEDYDLTVCYTDYALKCAECNKDIQIHEIIFKMPYKGKVCLPCAGLDHLVFLTSGDTALTNRSRKYSALSAVVMSYSKARKRYERKGIFVEVNALEQAKIDCEADAKKREIQRAKAAIRRAKIDEEYIKQFATAIRKILPYCPEQIEYEIAEHACEKYSGRVGRSAYAKVLNEQYVRLAVIAHIRHTETNYDELLSDMYDKKDAREMIRDSVDEIISLWEYGNSQSSAK